jgi:hypothetical protein
MEPLDYETPPPGHMANRTGRISAWMSLTSVAFLALMIVLALYDIDTSLMLLLSVCSAIAGFVLGVRSLYSRERSTSALVGISVSFLVLCVLFMALLC